MSSQLDPEYRAMVQRLFKEFRQGDGGLAATFMHAAVGISGEAGEVLDAVKKHWVYNKQIDRENIIEELGDIMFYMSKLMDMVGTSLDEVVDTNLRKLNKRYPNGYTDAAAQARADKPGLLSK